MRAISATLLMHTYTTPAMAPMQMAAQGSTYAHPAQMATIPVIDPASINQSINQSVSQSIGQSVAMIQDRERGKPHRIASHRIASPSRIESRYRCTARASSSVLRTDARC